MSEPIKLEYFLEALARIPRIQEEIATRKVETVQNLFDSGELEDFVKNESDSGDVIGGSGGPEHGFDIEIRSFGPLYWIHANEFDDIGYFASEEDAHQFASEEYGPYIDALDEDED